jgi:hypothetical protein
MFKKPNRCPHTLKSHNFICGIWCYISCLDRSLTPQSRGILTPMILASSFFVGYFTPRSLSLHIASDVGLTDELDMSLRERVRGIFEILSRHLLGQTEEKHHNPVIPRWYILINNNLILQHFPHYILNVLRVNLTVTFNFQLKWPLTVYIHSNNSSSCNYNEFEYWLC